MANAFFEHHWVLDTASATAITQDVIEGVLRWVAPSAGAADMVVIQDKNGNSVWESVATGANYVEETPFSLHADGFILATIDSGRVYVYFAK